MSLSSGGLRTLGRVRAQVRQWLDPAPGHCPQRPAAVAEISAPLLSVIIPTLNEARTLPSVLERLASAPHAEVIVVDGGSTDGTVAVAADWGARVMVSAPGRSHQMNRGAAAARGDMLLFLHADTRLPPGFGDTVRQTLAAPGVVAGAFRLAIDGPSPGLRWVEWGVNLRSRLFHMPYGDQAIFVPTPVFRALGGFPPLPMMEDFELMRRLKRTGRVAIAPAAVTTSDRRWRRLGILRTTLTNQGMILGYLLGVDPHRLARWYRYQKR